jgi:hypothetical protein
MQLWTFVGFWFGKQRFATRKRGHTARDDAKARKLLYNIYNII